MGSLDNGEFPSSACYLSVCYQLTLVALTIKDFPPKKTFQDGNTLTTAVLSGIRMLKTRQRVWLLLKV